MFTLVIGGAASGKSEFAEDLLLKSPRGSRVYIATMEPFDAECLARIERHRRLRAEKGFETVECYRDLAGLRLPPGRAVLLECMGNLCANELYGPDGSVEGAAEAVLAGVDALLKQCERLVVVSNEVFSGGSRYQGDTLDYLRLLATVNRGLAGRADEVCEISCGLPQYHKGGRVDGGA